MGVGGILICAEDILRGASRAFHFSKLHNKIIQNYCLVHYCDTNGLSICYYCCLHALQNYLGINHVCNRINESSGLITRSNSHIRIIFSSSLVYKYAQQKDLRSHVQTSGQFLKMIRYARIIRNFLKGSLMCTLFPSSKMAGVGLLIFLQHMLICITLSWLLMMTMHVPWLHAILSNF